MLINTFSHQVINAKSFGLSFIFLTTYVLD